MGRGTSVTMHGVDVLRSCRARLVAVLVVVALAIQVPGPVDAQPSVQRTRAALSAFFTAYNRQDLAAAMRIISPDINQFADCDWAFRRPTDGVGAQAAQARRVTHLRMWLRARFAEHDQFHQIMFDGADPGVQGVEAQRTSDVLAAQGLSPHQESFKIIMHGPNFDQIGHLVSISFNQCGGGRSSFTPVRFPPGASAVRTRTLVQAFLDAYNAHEVNRAMATVTKDVKFTDCDDRRARRVVIRDRARLGGWFRARFREGERLQDATIVMGNPDQSNVAAIEAERDSRTLRARHLAPVHATVTLVLRGPQYDRISSAVWLGPQGQCSLGRG